MLVPVKRCTRRVGEKERRGGTDANRRTRGVPHKVNNTNGRPHAYGQTRMRQQAEQLATVHPAVHSTNRPQQVRQLTDNLNASRGTPRPTLPIANGHRRPVGDGQKAPPTAAPSPHSPSSLLGQRDTHFSRRHSPLHKARGHPPPSPSLPACQLAPHTREADGTTHTRVADGVHLPLSPGAPPRPLLPPQTHRLPTCERVLRSGKRRGKRKPQRARGHVG